jgi:hypothetical protein
MKRIALAPQSYRHGVHGFQCGCRNMWSAPRSKAAVTNDPDVTHDFIPLSGLHWIYSGLGVSLHKFHGPL